MSKRTLALVILIPVSALVARAQMSAGCISVYNDAWTSDDQSTLYASSDTVDNCIECSHGNFSITITVIGPSGTPAARQTFAGSSGELGVNTSFAGPGTYTVYGVDQFFCSCAGRMVGASGPTASTQVQAPPVCPVGLIPASWVQFPLAANTPNPAGNWPTYWTGMGAVVDMIGIFSGFPPSLDGAKVQEVIIPYFTDCPRLNWNTMCGGNSLFTVGPDPGVAAADPTSYGYYVPPIGDGGFYDWHIMADHSDWLQQPSDPQSCTVQCDQTYYCTPSWNQIGSFMITKTLTHSFVGIPAPNAGPATIVSVTKTSQ